MDYEIGKIYDLDLDAVNQIKKGFFGANFIMDKPADLKLGRRFLGKNCWEFWLIDGRKVSVSFSGAGNTLSVSDEVDINKPTGKA